MSRAGAAGGARLFDGEWRIDDPLVLVEDGRIVGVRTGAESPPDATDLGGDPLTGLSTLGEVRAVYRSGRRV